MIRLLVLLTAALVIAYLLHEGLSRLRGKLGELLGSAPQPGRRAPGGRRDGQLVRCATCGIHVLRSRALAAPAGSRREAGGEADAARFWCGEACRQPLAAGSRSA